MYQSILQARDVDGIPIRISQRIQKRQQNKYNHTSTYLNLSGLEGKLKLNPEFEITFQEIYINFLTSIFNIHIGKELR